MRHWVQRFNAVSTVIGLRHCSKSLLFASFTRLYSLSVLAHAQIGESHGDDARNALLLLAHAIDEI